MGEPKEPTPVNVAGASVEGDGPRALVVDDSEAQLLVCTRVLTSHGYRVEAARNARSALVALQRSAFDVLVSDIHMPDMSGMELLVQVRASGLDIPVVLVTGDPTLDSAMKAMEHGVVRYLAKPVAPSALALAVNTVVRLHGLARAERLAMDNEALRSLVDELHRSKDAAVAGTRAKAEFLSKIGHELRTPMSGVIGYAELALTTEMSSEGREYIESLKAAAYVLMGVLADVLDVAALDAGRVKLEPKPFSVRDVIEATLTPLLSSATAKGLSMTAEVGSGVPDACWVAPPEVRADYEGPRRERGQITDVGEVRVGAHLEAHGGGEARLCVSVSDTGVGIPAEDLSRVVDAFAQQDNSVTRRFGGAGLGLTIATQLVAMMKGSLRIESTPKVGTTVRFTVCFQRVPVEDAFFVVDTHARPEAS